METGSKALPQTQASLVAGQGSRGSAVGSGHAAAMSARDRWHFRATSPTGLPTPMSSAVLTARMSRRDWGTGVSVLRPDEWSDLGRWAHIHTHRPVVAGISPVFVAAHRDGLEPREPLLGEIAVVEMKRGACLPPPEVRRLRFPTRVLAGGSVVGAHETELVLQLGLQPAVVGASVAVVPRRAAVQVAHQNAGAAEQEITIHQQAPPQGLGVGGL